MSGRPPLVEGCVWFCEHLRRGRVYGLFARAFGPLALMIDPLGSLPHHCDAFIRPRRDAERCWRLPAVEHLPQGALRTAMSLRWGWRSIRGDAPKWRRFGFGMGGRAREVGVRSIYNGRFGRVAFVEDRQIIYRAPHRGFEELKREEARNKNAGVTDQAQNRDCDAAPFHQFVADDID